MKDDIVIEQYHLFFVLIFILNDKVRVILKDFQLFLSMKISLIVAKSRNNAIGRNNQLLWHLPKDLKHFKKLTSGHHIIMGRKTYESIGRPLPNRVSIVITRNLEYQLEGCLVVNSPQEALQIAKQNTENELFIIGGEEIYRILLPHTHRLYITEVHTEIDGDAFFPQLSDDWREIKRQAHLADEKHHFDFDFVVYEKFTSLS